MIFLFRKEIQKWNKIWWVVIASLALGSVSFFFMRGPTKEGIKVATVNDRGVSLKTFHQTYAETKASLDELAMYWGIPVDRLAKMMGMKNMAGQALSQCVQNVLFDDLANQFSMNIDSKSFQEALAGTVSKMFVDRFGKINLDAYQSYLSRLHMTIVDYEGRKEKEFYRNAIVKFISQSAYVPSYVVDGLAEQKNAKKSFVVMTLSMSKFLEKAKVHEVSQEDLKKFFKEKQEMYRVLEKRKAKYVELTPEEYKAKVDVDDDIIERFYEKNKSALYRIPPKVKVRTIVSDAQEEADKMLAAVKENPKIFEEKGKLIDFFTRGTHDPEFEKVAFLQLKVAGDISNVVKTEKGFEILRLEERISASEKPLADVRNEVIEAIKNRRALIVLRGDLEAVMRTSRKDKMIFEKFSKTGNLKVNETDWLTKDDAGGYEMLDMIAQKIFTEKRALLSYGYFVHRGKHVLYKETEKEKSYIPEYDTVAGRVTEDWYEEKARKQQEKTVKKLRVELLGATIDAVAEKYGFGVVKTDALKPGEGDDAPKVDALKDTGSLLAECFALTDPSQLLVHQHKDDVYLARLRSSSYAEASEDRVEGLGKELQNMQKQRYLGGFIASLQRNAKIEIREDILKLQES